MTQGEFEKAIAPFYWVDGESSYSLCFTKLGQYRQDVFDSRADEGFEGGGYDWQSLAAVFLDEQMPQLKGVVRFDSESSMFCAYSKDADALRQFALGFKAACEDEALMRDLFSRAELD